MSFRRRLIVFSAAAVAVAIVLASVVGWVVVRGQLRGQVDASLRGLSGGAVAFSISGPGDEPAGERPDRIIERRLERIDPDEESRSESGGERGLDRSVVALQRDPFGGPQGIAQVVDQSGRVMPGPAAGAKLPVSERTKAVASGLSGPFYEDREVQGTHLRVYTSRLTPGEAVQVARPLDEVDRSLRNLGFVLAGVSLGGVGLAAGLGFMLARATLRPVAQLTDAAEHVTRTRDLSRRIEAGGRDELGRLATSFNTMLAALESSLRAQRRLVADASHELRTPLTSLRTNVELLERVPPDQRREMVADITAQLEELTLLVGDLMELAREDERELATEDVRLDLLVAGAVERARRHAPDRRFETTLHPAVVEGVPARIDRAVANLLDNAAKWSPPDDPIDVRVTAAGELTVRDRGPGIDQADLPHVFDRFYRAPSARGTPGSGLGLAIVRQVAESHGGSVTAESNGGGGTLLRLSL